MKIFLPILVIGFAIIFSSCQQKNSPAKQISRLNQSDTFYYEFPKRNGKFDSLLHKRQQRFEKEVGLVSLENGFDSIQIRIFYGGSFNGERLVILTNSNKKWSAEISKFIDKINPGFEDSVNADYSKRYSLSRETENKIPKSGWDKFIKIFFKFSILSLPDEESINSFLEESPTDGVGVFIEVATKNAYRAYKLGHPDYFYDKYVEMRTISEILKLVDEEFGLNKLWDYTREEHHEKTADTIRKIKMQEIQLQEIKPEKKKKKK